MNSHEDFIHIHQGCFAGTGAIVRLPQCQWSKPDGYGKISQCITTTKHSKAKTVCIFLGIYCRVRYWLGDVMHQAIALTNVGPGLCQHVKPLGHNEFDGPLWGGWIFINRRLCVFFDRINEWNKHSVASLCYRKWSVLILSRWQSCQSEWYQLLPTGIHLYLYGVFR